MLGLVVLLTVLSTLVFFFSRSLPGDVAAMYVGDLAKPEQIERARVELGLDKPLYIQYIRYWQKLLHGDLGKSLRTHRSVLGDLTQKIPMSLEVVVFALFFASWLGVSVGVFAALKQGTWMDEFIKWGASACVSIPIFFMALVLQLLFFNALGWFPLQGRLDSMLEFTNSIEPITGFSLIDCLLTGNFTALFNVAWHMVLPVSALFIGPFGFIARLTRSSLLEVMNQDYILSARASGVSERVLFFRYGLRNAMSPVITVIGMYVALMLLFTFYVEQIFNWPGIGSYSMYAILSLDYPVVIGVIMVIGSVYVITNTLTDIIRRVIDPRIK